MKTYTKNVSRIIGEMENKYSVSASSISKISNHSNNSFSMLAGPKYGCPGATEACKDCYATKNRHHFPNVQRKLAQNWLAVKKAERNKAPKKIVKMLSDVIPVKAKVFRLHESSDFYSDWYIDRWTEVIRSRRDTQFWAYTRSFHLNFQRLVRQPNFQLWASTDDYNQKEAEQFVKRYAKSGVRHAYGPLEHNAPIPANSIICPTTQNKLDINGACEKCKICFRGGKKNIVFLRH